MFSTRDEKNYWDFGKVKTSGIHKIAKYPAVMVAPMQYEIISSLIKKNAHYTSLLDPFHGSGVSLVEGGTIGLNVCGIDINPYAYLIAKVKLEALDEDRVITNNMEMVHNINRKRYYDKYEFNNISKWFRDDVIDDLSKLRHLISNVDDKKIRCYYWLCFGEIVRIHSNTRSSTFKLHMKEKEKIQKMENKVFTSFIERIKLYHYLIPRNVHYELFCDDSLERMKSFDSSSFDIICTSPPYGDNNTTVTYGQFSTLQLHWIDIEDIGCSRQWVENFSKIDSSSIGGAYSKNNLKCEYTSLSGVLAKISKEKQKKVLKFFSDYEIALFEMARVLRPGGTMVLTLANRRVDNTELPLIGITQEMVTSCGLSVDEIISRNIKNKRMPYKLSNVSKYGAVPSMSKEAILIITKPQENRL